MTALMSAPANAPTTTPDSKQHVWIEPATRDQAQPIHQGDSCQRSDERSDRHGPGAAGSGGDGDYCSETGSAR